MCMALRDVISSILTMFSSSCQDEDENDAVTALTARHESPPLCSRTRFVTTTGGVQVSLVLVVIAYHDASSGFFHQRTTARWTFSAAGGHFVVFVQEPTQIFRSVTLPVFKSYAVALLKTISRRSVDWAISSKWKWAATTVSKQVARTVSKECKYNEEKDDENECVAKEEVERKWTVNPRYLDYERTWAYASKRQENLERRRLQQRKRGKLQKSRKPLL